MIEFSAKLTNYTCESRMSIEATNNSFPIGNIPLPQTTAKPSLPNNPKKPSLLQITIVKNSLPLLSLSQNELNTAVKHKTQIEPSIKESHKQRLSQKASLIMLRIQLTPQQKDKLESIAATESNRMAEEAINALRKTLPENIRIALKTEEILKKPGLFIS